MFFTHFHFLFKVNLYFSLFCYFILVDFNGFVFSALCVLFGECLCASVLNSSHLCILLLFYIRWEFAIASVLKWMNKCAQCFWHGHFHHKQMKKPSIYNNKMRADAFTFQFARFTQLHSIFLFYAWKSFTYSNVGDIDRE